MAASDGLRQPTVLDGVHVVPPLLRFLRDPLRSADQLSQAHGDFVELRFPLRAGRMPASLVFTAAAPHFRQILGDPGTWRTVNIAAAGRRNHASSRLSKGLVRMRGQKHEHFRRLIAPPLRRTNILKMGHSLGLTADRISEGWPENQTIDLLPLVRSMMQRLAAVHLFGGDDKAACDIARMISTYVAASWSLPINLFRLNLPGTPYHHFLRNCEALEACILDWARRKKGNLDPQDLLSIIVNSADEDGKEPRDAVIAGHVPTMFGASYETCQNALVWLLILISQHPQIEQSLREEITRAVKAAPPALDVLAELPLLDAVVKEALRILPPVPNQYRVALNDTQLSGYAVSAKTRAVLSAFVRNRDPALYPQPDCFIPKRWRDFDPSPFQYAVFSAGPRACPGFGFGTSVLKVSLAAILRRYRVVLAEGSRIDYRVTVALVPHPAVMARLVKPTGSGRAPPLHGRIRQLVRLPG